MSWKEKYYNYLKSDKWKEIRERKLKSINFICEECKISKATQIHHIHYETLENEKNEDLLAVCKKCHLLLELEKCNNSVEIYDIDLITDVKKSAKRYLKTSSENRKGCLLEIEKNILKWDIISRGLFIYLFERAIDEIIMEWHYPNKIPNYSQIKCYKNVIENGN